MKAERDRRAAILNAEGTKASQILTAEGEKQSQILRAEGSAQARILEAQGQARAIQQVFDAIHRGKPTQKLLAYQYLQVLPQIARGDSNKMWIIPSELTDALRGIGGALGATKPTGDGGDDEWVDPGDAMGNAFEETTLEDPKAALERARGQAAQSSREAEEHAAPASRVQPPVRPGADAVPPREAPPAPPAPPAPTEELPPPPPPAPPAAPQGDPGLEPPR